MRALLTIALLLIPGWAGAQDADASPEPPSARALFEQGMEALGAGDANLAEERFRASLALDARASTAVNLALVLQERGGLLEAIALYDALLAAEYGESPVSTDEIRGFRARAEQDLAVLAIATRGDDALEVMVDGDVAGALRPGVELTLRVDPGVHVVVGHAADVSAQELRIELARRERRRVELQLPTSAGPTTETSAPSSDPPENGSAVLSASMAETTQEDAGDSSALPWVLVGLGSAAVIAAVVIAAVLSSSGSDAYSAEPIPNVTALTIP